jgi:aspartyl-tRNA(Asn)/glutamyl-tRNA(Gln) amidotransferase subunit A
VILGKTATSEFGLGGQALGASGAPTRNPWDPTRTPGGSSSGAVASVAAGLSPLAVGTDGGGSIRVPSAYSGVVGFKPSFGIVAHAPAVLIGVPAHVGPIARSVADGALLFSVLTGSDARDPFHVGLRQPQDWRDQRDGSLEGLVIAAPRHPIAMARGASMQRSLPVSPSRSPICDHWAQPLSRSLSICLHQR